MSTSFEADLRAGLRDCAALMPAAGATRLGEIDYWPRAGATSKRLRRLSIVSGFGAALTGGAVAAALLFSSTGGTLGVPMAYADWSATPSTPTPAALAASIAACNRIDSWTHYNSTPLLEGQPVLTDAREKYVASVFVVGKQLYECISNGHDNGSLTAGNSLALDFYAAPGRDQLGQPTGSGGTAPGFPGAKPNQPLPMQVRTAMENDPELKNNPALLAKLEDERRAALDRGVESNLLGRAGSDIAAVTFVFANGKTVDATVENGWYFAWWPNIDKPASVHVTTRSGQSMNSQLNCKTGSSSCVFAGINRQDLPPAGTTTAAPRPPVGVPMRTTRSASPTTSHQVTP